MTSGKPSGLRLFAGVVILLIAGAVVGGLYLSGSPSTERGRQFDNQRLNSLQQIASAVDNYYYDNNQLPADLGMLMAAKDQMVYLSGSLNDPQTQAPYEYNQLGGPRYELCAVFDLPSEPAVQSGGPMSAPVAMPAGPGTKSGTVRSWDHGAGRACFQLNATDRAGVVRCNLTNPCQSGQSCIELSANRGTVCVPQGKECLAAGCSGDCVLSQNYPAQVVCNGAPAAGSDCRLLQDPKTGKVDCFGCANGICKDPPAGWKAYAPAKDAVGIPYACFTDTNGCALAQ